MVQGLNIQAMGGDTAWRSSCDARAEPKDCLYEPCLWRVGFSCDGDAGAGHKKTGQPANGVDRFSSLALGRSGSGVSFAGSVLFLD